MHSLHAYFLRRGDFNAPIVYEVDRSRDGASFSSRRVVAIQHGQQIFNMAASFQIEEDGPDHQVPMPEVAPPEELPDLTAEVRKHLVAHAGRATTLLVARAPVRVPFGRGDRGGRAAARSAQPLVPPRRALPGRPGPAPLPARLHVRLPPARDGDAAARARVPRRATSRSRASTTRCGSIDRCAWTNGCCTRSISPSSSGSRGFAFGRIFDRDGRLVASTAQEGLMRTRN